MAIHPAFNETALYNPSSPNVCPHVIGRSYQDATSERRSGSACNITSTNILPMPLLPSINPYETCVTLSSKQQAVHAPAFSKSGRATSGSEASRDTFASSVSQFEVDDNASNSPGSSADVCSSDGESTKNQSLLVPCVAVYSSNYNFSVLAIAMYIMNQDIKYEEATNNAVSGASIKMLAYAGAVFGQFTMGYLGDLIGRKKAMLSTLLLIFSGAMGSALCVWGDALTSLILMGLFRFILGVGSGGVYPLSAVSAAEGTASSKAEDRSPRVSWAYFFNVPGIISPYALAAITWNLTRNVEINFRVLLAFGALPVLFIIYNAFNMKDSEEFRKSKSKELFSALLNRQHWRHLIGTGICWFLYDVTSYGILLVQPDITAKIWGAASTVNDVIWQGVVLNSIGIPGALMGILVVKQMGLKWLQFWGFIALAASSAAMAVTASVLAEKIWLQMLMLAFVNFFINWGAAVTTFIIPSTVFPPECRSTYNGISAAMGKVGAVVGIYSLKAVLYSAGIAPMMCVAAAASLLGAILTWFFVGQVPKTCKSAASQCFGSLLACIPFCDLRKRNWC